MPWPHTSWPKERPWTRSARIDIVADRSGVFGLDLDRLRSAMVTAQAQAGAPFSDPVGLELLERPRTLVENGQPLARLRTLDDRVDVAAIKAAFNIAPG